MKTFKQFIQEQITLNEALSYRRKGWINVKTGKMVLYAFAGRGLRPYHDEYVVNNPKKFVRGGEEELLRRFAAASGFEPEDEETTSMWIDIKTGKVDRDPNLDSILEKEGWRRVVFDEGISSVEPLDRREGQKLVKMIMDQIPWSKIENLNVFDKGHLNDMTELYSEDDAYNYIKTGRVVRRTSIGRTMAMFREESVINEAKMRGIYFKGWMTPRGKVVIHATTATGTSKYHIQILTDLFPFEKMRPHMGEWVGADHLKFLQRMKKDGIADFADDQVKDLIEKQYKAVYKQWATGKIDQDRGVEEKFMKMGWVKIWIDRNQYGMSMIQGNDKRKVLDCAKKLDKKFGGWDGFMTKSMSISTQTDIGARIGSVIHDSSGWENYLRTGEVRRHQTEIGRKMAMFREKKEYQWLLPDYPEQIPASEDEGDWAMGDPDDPIDWKDDHKKVYRDVMKDRKKKNPKYHIPTKKHNGD